MCDSEARRALPVTHGVRDISAQNAHEQEHLTGALEPGQGKGAAAAQPVRSAPVRDGKQEINTDDLDEAPVQSAKLYVSIPTEQHLLRQQADEFAIKYWRFLGARPWEESKARKEWPGTFLPLIEQHGLDLIKTIARWAKNHERIGKYIARYRGSDDSAEWLVDNFPDLLSQRANEADRQTKKHPAQSSSRYKPVEYPAAASYPPAGQPKISIGIDPTR